MPVSFAAGGVAVALAAGGAASATDTTPDVYNNVTAFQILVVKWSHSHICSILHTILVTNSTLMTRSALMVRHVFAICFLLEISV